MNQIIYNSYFKKDNDADIISLIRSRSVVIYIVGNISLDCISNVLSEVVEILMECICYCTQRYGQGSSNYTERMQTMFLNAVKT